MSRDWTLVEMYVADLQMGGKLHEMKITRTIAGVDHPVPIGPSAALKKKYPLLSFLWCDYIEKAAAKIPEETLLMAENRLKELTEEVEVSGHIIHVNDTKKDFMFQWFVGDLDPGFYDCTGNHSIFFAKLKEYGKKKQKREESDERRNLQ